MRAALRELEDSGKKLEALRKHLAEGRMKRARGIFTARSGIATPSPTAHYLRMLNERNDIARGYRSCAF